MHFFKISHSKAYATKFEVANFVVLKFQMLHTKFQGNWLSGPGEAFKVFTIYGHDGHLGDVTWTNYANINFPIL